jgi:hypothetical protein
MSQRNEMRLISKFKKGNTRMEKLNNGSWKKVVADSGSIWNAKGKYPSYWNVWRRIIFNSPVECVKLFPPSDIGKCSVSLDAPLDIKVMVTWCYEDCYFLVEFRSKNSDHSESPATINLNIEPNDDDDLDPGVG